MKNCRPDRRATKTTGTRSANADPLYDYYVWQSPSTLFEHQPTVRLDYNLTDNNRPERIVVADHRQADPDYLNNADPRFPGAPEPARLQVSTRPLLSTALRSVLSKNIVNELRGGVHGLRGRLELRLSVRRRVAQRSDHVRRRPAATPSPRPATRPTGTRRTARPGAGADLQHRRDADLAERRACDHHRRQPADLERDVVEPADRAGHQHRVQHRLRPGDRSLQHDQLPGGVE
jgi:hypothetical protein